MNKILSAVINYQKKFSIGSASMMLQILVVILLWALCFPLITTGLTAFSPFYFAALRCLVAGVSLFVVAFILKRPLIPERGVWFPLVLASITFASLGFTGMFLAGDKVSPGLATVIANIQPLLAALLGYFLLTERLTKLTSIALFIGFLGILIISYSGLTTLSTNSTPAGIGLVLIGAIGVAIGNIILKLIVNRVDSLIAMAWLLLLGAIPLAIAAVIFEEINEINWSGGAVINLLILSIPGTALAFYWWLILLSKLDLNVLNSYTFLAPVFSLLIGMFFYNERLLIIEWLGVIVIVSSIFLACMPKKKLNSEE